MDCDPLGRLSIDAAFVCRVAGVEGLKIEEMEQMLKEAQLEKARLIECRVRRMNGRTLIHNSDQVIV